jgi:hypothetical protein
MKRGRKVDQWLVTRAEGEYSGFLHTVWALFPENKHIWNVLWPQGFNRRRE